MRSTARDARLGALDFAVEPRADGTLLVRSTVPLPPHPATMIDRLEHWAEQVPERTFLAQRDPEGQWRRVSYAETLARVRRLAAALLERRLTAERPIVVLSDNDIEHALLTLAAMSIGVPVSPISPAYSLLSSDFGKLRHILAQLDPQLVFAADAGRYAKAIAACCHPGIEIVATQGEAPGQATTAFAGLERAGDVAAVARARSGIGPDAIAKVLFTSGSTSVPKGVVTTQRMLTVNQAMLRHWLPFLAVEPPVLLDWLPWSHTFGGSHNFGLVLYNGGTLYIDEGKPTPQGIAATLHNLAEIAPTLYFNVPHGYEQLVAAMRRDEPLRAKFFSRLRLMFYASAGLPRHTAAALDELAELAIGRRLMMVNGFGATETAPAALASTPATVARQAIGLPLPGVTMKLVPNAGKLELRLASPAVMPGYWKDPATTAKAFDEEGFYKLGDAVRLADPGDPASGFYFDGRLTEDFKLSTGTWVSVGPLRARVIAALAPLIKDIVITGHDRGEIGGLVFPEVEACRALLPAADRGMPETELLARAEVREAIRDRFSALAQEGGGSSTRLMRVVLLAEPPSVDANEITDKGSINQRAVLMNRAALVTDLYAPEPPAHVISA